jgi:hypothetical protein
LSLVRFFTHTQKHTLTLKNTLLHKLTHTYEHKNKRKLTQTLYLSFLSY